MKKGDAGLIIVMALVSVTMIILAFSVFPAWRKGLQKQTGFEGCSADLYLEAILHKGTAGQHLIQAGCKIKQVKIDRNYLRPYEALARASGDDVQGSAAVEWAIKRAVADTLKDCHDTAWGGNDFVTKELAAEAMKMETVGDLPVGISYSLNDFGCVFCARITFGDDVKEIFPNRRISLYDYMNTHNVFAGKTYTDYLAGRHPVDFYKSWLRATSSLKTDEATMVMFAAKNVFGAGDARGAAGLYKYDTVLTDVTTGLRPIGTLQRLRLIDADYGVGKCGFTLGTL